MQSSTELLRDFWYVASPATQLARGGMLPVTLLGEQILIVRANDGAVSALRDFCPHRGIPLRYGKFDGCEVECCYHGWRFNTSGTCTSIPSMVDDKTDLKKIKTGSYACVEKDGLIWIYNQPPPNHPICQHPSAADSSWLIHCISLARSITPLLG